MAYLIEKKETGHPRMWWAGDLKRTTDYRMGEDRQEFDDWRQSIVVYVQSF